MASPGARPRLATRQSPAGHSQCLPLSLLYCSSLCFSFLIPPSLLPFNAPSLVYVVMNNNILGGQLSPLDAHLSTRGYPVLVNNIITSLVQNDAY